jgi:hypothetical protein
MQEPETIVQTHDEHAAKSHQLATILFCNSFYDALHLLEMHRDIFISTHCLAYRDSNQGDQLQTVPAHMAHILSSSAERWFKHMQRGIFEQHRRVIEQDDPLPQTIDPTLPYPSVVGAVACAVHRELVIIDNEGNFDPMQSYVKAGTFGTQQDFAVMQSLSAHLRQGQRDLLDNIREYIWLQSPIDPDDLAVQNENPSDITPRMQQVFTPIEQAIYSPPPQIERQPFYISSASYVNQTVAGFFNNLLNGNNGVASELTGGILAQSAIMATVMDGEDMQTFSTKSAITPMAKRMRALQGAVETLEFVVRVGALENRFIGFYEQLYRNGKPLTRRPNAYAPTMAFLSAALCSGANALGAAADHCDKGHRFEALVKPDSIVSYQLADTKYHLN